jgi:hypothetical protein
MPAPHTGDRGAIPRRSTTARLKVGIRAVRKTAALEDRRFDSSRADQPSSRAQGKRASRQSGRLEPRGASPRCPTIPRRPTGLRRATLRSAFPEARRREPGRVGRSRRDRGAGSTPAVPTKTGFLAQPAVQRFHEPPVPVRVRGKPLGVEAKAVGVPHRLESGCPSPGRRFDSCRFLKERNRMTVSRSGPLNRAPSGVVGSTPTLSVIRIR